MIKMTANEKAYMDSGGAVHPETGKPATEETTDVATTEAEQTKQPDPADDGGGEKKSEGDEAKETQTETDEGDDEEEIVDVANADGETRRKMIAFGAYEKQRKQAKALREQSENMARQLAYLTGALQQVQGGKPVPETQQQAPQISATPPDYKTKPQEWLDWVNNTVAHAATFTQQQGQMTAQQQQFNQLNDAVVQHEQAFVNGNPASGVEAHPDFYEALTFLQNRHRAELTEAGYDAPTIQKIMAARAQDVAVRALQAGKSPAERVYAIAKVQGYRKAAPKPAQESEAEKVARQAVGQSKAKTISTLAGGAEKGLSIETMANMPQDQFNKIWQDGTAQALLGIPK